jgi:MOSC domain-containing protein YiiM
METEIGRVLGIAVRTAEGGPMREIDRAEAAVDCGLAGDLRSSPDRGVTLISAQQWRRALADIGADLPWHTRRANVLVDAASLEPLIGQRIRIGDVEIDVVAETKPCGVMDQLHQGLKMALAPDCRGGVYGRIVRGGALRVGDSVLRVPRQ